MSHSTGQVARRGAARAVPVEGAVRASRWPWALAAAVAGAAAGTAVLLGLRRVHAIDRPEAVEPDEVRAVVDRPDPST